MLVFCCQLNLISATPGSTQQEVLVKFKKDVQTSRIDSLTRELGLARIKTVKEIRVEVFQVSSRHSVEEVIEICSRLPFVEYAEPNQTVHALPQAPAALSVAAPSEPPAPTQEAGAVYKKGELLLKFKPQLSQQSVNTLFADVGLQMTKTIDELGVYVCAIGGNKSVDSAVAECRASSDVAYAEPNYIYRASIVPNDPRFSSLYGMTMIRAPEAWDVQTGSKSVIVGIIDTGVDTDHKDLRENIWHNPGESGNGRENNKIDDDGNGFVDDYRGWDFIHNDNNPFDDHNHGSHVAGTVGAVGNNSEGVVGVCWGVSLMALKFLDARGSGDSDDAIEAIIYASNMGAKVLSNSWGGSEHSQALEDAIKFANEKGVLFVAAAGNDFSNNDKADSFPANYEVGNVISVAANTRKEKLAGFSNFGSKSVDLAAPGSDILSTVTRGRFDVFSGTSMATPHVSGAAALVLAEFPDAGMQEVIIRILGGVDRNANYAGKVATGGRLNVNNSISRKPLIARTTRLANTLDETGPYVIESDVVDDAAIASVTLTYQVVGQEARVTEMTSIEQHRYHAEIPGQELGSTIVYFVGATDNDGNNTKDNNFTFSIAEPEDDGGCGRPPINFELDDPWLEASVNTLSNLVVFVFPFVLFRFGPARRRK